MSASAAITTGTLTRKTARQSKAVTSPPPSSGATDIARPAAIAHAATPRLSSDAGRDDVITARDSAYTAPPPIPCTIRLAISTVTSGARPHASDPAPKTTRPQAKTRRRPTMSPKRLTATTDAATAAMYAPMTHCSPAVDASRSSWMPGRARFTALASVAIAKIPIRGPANASLAHAQRGLRVIERATLPPPRRARRRGASPPRPGAAATPHPRC